ncbi:hypothetical protein ACFCW2_07475 [Qipengyuania sp. DSG2-2]|uniref:nSTAND1 domain-containing NTPase n=1 Tax=Qipengyuania sp. DGS2-2 TaxID=3349631 RepID=UPI0036D2AE60
MSEGQNHIEQVPFPGLRAFTRDESYLFFGRDSQVTELIDKLADSRFLAVLGSSGSGKSSLVRTGLLEYLELGLHPAGSDWMVIDFHPAGDPIGSLAAGLFAAQGMDVKGEEFDLMAHSLRRGPRAVIEWCQAGHLPEGRNLLLMADQFEELFRFSSYAEREEAEAFARLLIESSECPDFPISVCLTMRTEFLADCAMIPGLAERINDGLYLTPRMNRDECEEAIVGPAGVSGFEVEPKLANQLLNDMATLAPWEDKDDVSQTMASRADQLPLMQHVLNQLYLETKERDGDDNIVLRRDHYREIGGLTGALDVHGLQVLERLGAAPSDPDRVPAKGKAANDTRAPGEVDHTLVAQVFRALVAGPSLAKAVRRPCRFDELARATGDEAATRTVVDAFRAHGVNFLRPYEGEPLADDTVIDISHESLIRQWNLLTGWFEEEREAGVAWQQLHSQQEAFADGRSDLLTGLALANLSEFWESERPTAAWAERHGGDFAAIESFYKTSKETDERQRAEAEAEQRRKTNRLRVWLAGTAALAFVALGGAYYGFTQAAEARSSEAAALAATEEQKKATEAQALAAERAGLAEKRAEDEAAAALLAANQAEAAALAQQEAAQRAALSEQQAQSNLAEARAAEAAAEAARRQAEEQADANVDLIRRIGEAITVGGGTEEVTGDELRDEVRERLPDQSRAAPRVQPGQGGGSAIPLALAVSLPLTSEASLAASASASSAAAPEARSAPRERPCLPEWQLIAELEPDRQMDRLPGSLQTQCLARELAQFFEAQLSRSGSLGQGSGPGGGSADPAEILQINTMLGKAWFTARNWKESIGAYERAHDAGLRLLERRGRQSVLDDPKLRSAYLQASYNWLLDAREVRQSGKAQRGFSDIEAIAAGFDVDALTGAQDMELATDLARIAILQMTVHREYQPDPDKQTDAELRLLGIANLILEWRVDLDFDDEAQMNSALEALGVIAQGLTEVEDDSSAAENAELTCDISETMELLAPDPLDRRVTRAKLNCAIGSLAAATEEAGSVGDIDSIAQGARARARESLAKDPFDERTRLALIDANMAGANRSQASAKRAAEALIGQLKIERNAAGKVYFAARQDKIDEEVEREFAKVSAENRSPSRKASIERSVRSEFQDTPELAALKLPFTELGERIGSLENLEIEIANNFGSSDVKIGKYCDASLVQTIASREGATAESIARLQQASSVAGIWDDAEVELTLADHASKLSLYSQQCLAQINEARGDFSYVLSQSDGKALRRWSTGLFVDIGWREWADARDEAGVQPINRQDFIDTAIDVSLVTLSELPGSFQTLDTVYQIVKREENDDDDTTTGLVDDARALQVTNAALTRILQGDRVPTFWDRHVVNLGCRMHGDRLDMMGSTDLSTLVSAARELQDYCQPVADDRIWAAYTRNALQSAFHKLAHVEDADGTELFSTREGFNALYPYLDWASKGGNPNPTGDLVRVGEDFLGPDQMARFRARQAHQKQVFGFGYENDFGRKNTWYFRHSDDPLWGGEAFLAAMDTYNRGVGPESAREFLAGISRFAAERSAPMPVLAQSILSEAEAYLPDDPETIEKYAKANELLAFEKAHLPVDARGIAFAGYLPESIRAGSPKRPEVPMYGWASGGLYAVEDDTAADWGDWPSFNGFDPVALARGDLVAGSPRITGEIAPEANGMLSTYALFASEASLRRWQADPAGIALQAADQWVRLKPEALHYLADRERIWARARQVFGAGPDAIASANAAMSDVLDRPGATSVEKMTLAANAMLPSPGRSPVDDGGIAFGGTTLESVAPRLYRRGSSDATILFRGARVALADRRNAEKIAEHWPLLNGWDPVELAKGNFVSGLAELANDPSDTEDPRPYALFASEANREAWKRGDGSLYLAARENWLAQRPDYAGDLPADDSQLVEAANFAQAVAQELPEGVNATIALAKSVQDSAEYTDKASAEGIDAMALRSTLNFATGRTPTDAQGFAFGGHSVWAMEGGEAVLGDRTLPVFYRGALVATKDDEDMFEIRGAWPIFNGYDPVEIAEERATPGLPEILELNEKYGFERPVLFSSEENRNTWAQNKLETAIAAANTLGASNAVPIPDIKDDIFDLWEIAISQRLAGMIPEVDESDRVELAYEMVWELRDSQEFAPIESEFDEGLFSGLNAMIDLGVERLAINGRRTPVNASRVAFGGVQLHSIIDGAPVAGEEGDLEYYRGALYARGQTSSSSRDEYWPGFNGWDPVALSQGRFVAGRAEHVFVNPQLSGPLMFATAESLAEFEDRPGDILSDAIDQWSALLPEFAADVDDLIGGDDDR